MALAGKLRIRPRTIFVSGDILLPSVEKRIHQAWGVPIYNLYGASESLFLGVQAGQKEMTLMDDLNIFEVLGGIIGRDAQAKRDASPSPTFITIHCQFFAMNWAIT